MIVAGIGCRKGATAEEIDAAIDEALKQARIAPSELDALATSAKENRVVEVTPV